MNDPVPFFLLGGGLMALITLTGGLLLLIGRPVFERLLPGLLGLAAGSLIGGSLFRMVPMSFHRGGLEMMAISVVPGILIFLLLDLALRKSNGSLKSQVPLLLLGDGFHNLVGGLSIGAAFIIDPAVGLAAYLAAVLHEIPQEIGDFGILMEGGMSAGRSLLWNLISGLTFPVGMALNMVMLETEALPFLVGLGAGNFLYLGIIMMPGAVANAGEARALGIAGLGAGLLLQILIPHAH